MTDTYLNLVKQIISFKSVSTDPNYSHDISDVTKWLMKEFKSNNFQTTTFKGQTCNPVIFASYGQNRRLKTVLVYGHYDVQPADIADGWISDPWKLSQRDGRLFGRGVVDNKGQILIHMATVFDLIKSKRLAYNVKFLIEGNEETSNPDLHEILNKHKSELSSDIVLISDGELTNERPTIDVSLRGGFNLKLVFKTAPSALHSGIFGGAIPNAAYELSRFLSGLHNPQRQVVYSEFYAQVDDIRDDQRENNLVLAQAQELILATSGTKVLLTEEGSDFYTQTGLRPTIQITGFKSGYIGEGYANIIPHEAEARLNFRIVASQKYDQVEADFREYVRATVPEYIEYSITSNHHHNPVKIDTSSAVFADTEKILEEVYMDRVIKKNVGGAIPFITDVKEVLGVDALSVSLANEDCNMHGVDENFRVDLIEKGLDFSKRFFAKA